METIQMTSFSIYFFHSVCNIHFWILKYSKFIFMFMSILVSKISQFLSKSYRVGQYFCSLQYIIQEKFCFSHKQLDKGTFLANLFRSRPWKNSCKRTSCSFKTKKDYFHKDPIISDFKFIRNHEFSEIFYEKMYQFNAKHAMNI